jgi:precorrin-2/cobalt-factor-2 C20-methyltransferase
VSKFYGIGVGPGDPELLTVKAVRVLGEAGVVCVPISGPDRDSLALQAAAPYLPAGYETMELSFPMSRDRSVLTESWRAAGEAVAARVAAGRVVVFLTLGDPLLYSTYGYLLRYLKRHHPECPRETVPGITSFGAAAAAAGEPLAEGEESLAVLPCAYGLEAVERALDTFDNVVLLKVHRRLPEITALLAARGLLEHAFLASRVGREGQFFSTDIENVSAGSAGYMSLIVVKRGNDR